MPLEPRHPDEPPLHVALRDAFNRELKNTNFFLWLDVRPSGRGREFGDLTQIVAETEAWLGMLNPDEVAPDRLPEYWLHTNVADVKLRAIPRKPSVRGRRATEIVGNPGPILVGYEG